MSELIQHLKAVPNCVHYSALIHEAARELEKIEAERDALQAAKKACIDIYMDLHVSEMKGKPEHLKQAWSVGNILYIKNLEGEG
jgi:hypothetical protein